MVINRNYPDGRRQVKTFGIDSDRAPLSIKRDPPSKVTIQKGRKIKNWRKRVGVEPTHRGLDRYTGFEAQEGHRNPMRFLNVSGTPEYTSARISVRIHGFTFRRFHRYSYLAHAFGPVEEAGPDSEEPQWI